MILLTAPQPNDVEVNLVPVFIGGSIDQGAAWNWQEFMISELADEDVLLFNPRRPAWDAAWIQAESNPEFVEQVNWELDRIDESMIVFLYFGADTKSPITLMELGIVATQHVLSDDNMSMVVVCEPGFWRRGNVEILCKRNNVPLYTTLEQGIQAVKEDIEFWSGT